MANIKLLLKDSKASTENVRPKITGVFQEQIAYFSSVWWCACGKGLT